MNSKSTFRYIIIDKKISHKEIKEEITEELKRGFSFIISSLGEETVHLSGERKGWVTTHLHGTNIDIQVDDSFFCGCVLEQILTSLWANLLDYGELRLEEFKLSKILHDRLILEKLSRREFLRLNGPYFGTVFKPSFGLNLSEKLSIARSFGEMGGNFIKEDETYLIEKAKLLNEAEAIQNAMNSVSDGCAYVPNVTPYLLEDDLFQVLYDVGIRTVMVNYLINGLPIIHKVVKKHRNLLFWGHRVGYRSIEKYISMKAMALLATYSGMNMIHIGTPFFFSRDSVESRRSILKALGGISSEVMPVFTKSSPEIIPPLIESFGTGIIIMACGSIRSKGYLDWRKIRKVVEMVKK